MTFRQALALPKNNMVLSGILLMLLGDFMFALNDAMGKWLVENFSVGQVLFIRSIGAFIILGPMIYRQGLGPLTNVERPACRCCVSCSPPPTPPFSTPPSLICRWPT